MSRFDRASTDHIEQRFHITMKPSQYLLSAMMLFLPPALALEKKCGGKGNVCYYDGGKSCKTLSTTPFRFKNHHDGDRCYDRVLYWDCECRYADADIHCDATCP
ncbi:uncharacterized protein MYCGRDRAFT_104462 [Zymoseptoria tritici IPO323]|uniref:Uncharacterized protein n=1 Tax=Zymoseptoria tritici (strain CBS 115943 / IPO323) TaxID=336722 RepID=F9XBX0_ZYMTI|nr:uncharacterized protein MYCGRDRAFT_104462 [Zymoseptoria tritici IPO323]EGP87646.1 hypothetical protein MYCGRDRAFT_104462 [Zymoseptoria tritici IPO323]